MFTRKYQPIYRKTVVKFISKYLGRNIDSYMVEVHSFKSMGFEKYIAEYCGHFYCVFWNDATQRYNVSTINFVKPEAYVNGRINEEVNNE